MSDILDNPINRQIEAVEARLLSAPQVECPVEHFFAPSTYCRMVTVPADTFVIGHRHLTTHLNFVLTGRALFNIGGVVQELKAGDVFTSEAGAQKMAIVYEEMKFATVHPNASDETDTDKLFDTFYIKSESCKAFEREIESLKQAATHLNQKALANDESREV